MMITTKIIKIIQISIMLLIASWIFVQPAYTAPPPPDDENIIIRDKDAFDGMTPEKEVVSGITATVESQENENRVYLPVVFSDEVDIINNQIAVIVKQHPIIQNRGVQLLNMEVEGEAVVIDLSQEIFSDGRFDPVPFQQLSQTLNDKLDLHQRYMLTFKVEGKMLDQWGMTVAAIEPILDKSITAQSGPLAGKKVALNPGHGRYDTGSGWAWQRGEWWGIREDLVNAEMQMYVAQYLNNVGATVIYLREPDKNAGVGDSGLSRWQEAARHYLEYRGTPTSVWNPPMSSCSIGPINLCKDLMARPYGANHYGADLLVSLHNNGGGGTGTETYYDTLGTYHDATAAGNLAQKVHTRVMNKIRTEYNSGWADRNVKGRAGNYGENYYARMPAILIEVAFMDTQSPDNNALHNETFKKLVAEAIVLGICDYYGVSCPNVTDSSPPTTTATLTGTLGINNWYRSNIQVTLNAEDNSGGSGVDYIEYRINDSSSQTYTNTFTLSAQGVYTINYRAKDNAGNWESEQQIIFGIDTANPTGGLVINNDASVTHATLVYLNTTTYDTLSGVSQMRVRNAGGTWSDWFDYASKYLWQLPGITGQTFSVEIQLKDRAGNESIIYSDTIPLDIYPEQPASSSYRLAKSTIGVSGGPSSSNGYRLRGTLEQPSAVSIMTGTHTIASLGYWQAAPTPSAVVADFTATPTSGTIPLTVTFTNTSGGGEYTTSLWSFGDGITSTLTSPVHTYTEKGIYTVTLTVNGAGGMDTITRAQYITTYSPAQANFTATPVTGIAPFTVTFTNIATGDYDTTLWDFGDGITSTLSSPTHTYTIPGVYTSTFTVAGPGGQDTFTRTNHITVYAPVTANFSASPRNGLPPLTVTFTNTSTGDYTTILWNFGDGITSTLTNPTHTYSALGTYTVTLTVSGAGGSDTLTETEYISVNPSPVYADFTASPTAGIGSLTVTFTNTTTGDYTNSLWNFGDGITSTLTNPTHTYNSPGVYTVTLNTSGPGGTDTRIRTHYITVYDQVQANFTATPLNGVRPLLVTFTDMSTGDYTSRLWDFGDGNTSTLTNPVHTYTTAGTYTVTLTVNGPGGTDIITRTTYITVNPVPAYAEFSASPTQGEMPLTVTFTNLSGGDYTGCEWYFGDGDSVVSCASTISHTYQLSNTYTVSLIINGPGGTDTLTRTNYITVEELAGFGVYLPVVLK